VRAPRRVHGAELGVLIFSLILPATHLYMMQTAAKKNQGH
jgi:hypothetical protein